MTDLLKGMNEIMDDWLNAIVKKNVGKLSKANPPPVTQLDLTKIQPTDTGLTDTVLAAPRSPPSVKQPIQAPKTLPPLNLDLLKRKAVEEAKRKAVEEAKLKAVEEAKRKAVEEAKRKAVEEAKLKAVEDSEQKADTTNVAKENEQMGTEDKLAKDKLAEDKLA